MSDQDRRALARLAGDGDLLAARRLVALLEREQNIENWIPAQFNEPALGDHVKIIEHKPPINTVGEWAGTIQSRSGLFVEVTPDSWDDIHWTTESVQRREPHQQPPNAIFLHQAEITAIERRTYDLPSLQPPAPRGS